MAIYVHIPFCKSKCYYCDFYSLPRTQLADSFVEAVGNEWQLRRDEAGTQADTIYIGGGTPSQLTAAQFARLMSFLPVPLAGAEVTVEANPEDVTAELIDAWRACGVNRVSMGVQSMVDSELAAVGRRHDAAGAARAYDLLRRGGIDNISLDLIYGLPGQTPETWQRSLDALTDMQPEHISAYMLSYEQGTRLYAMRSTGKVRETDEDVLLDMYARLCGTLAYRGYEHYEISNFARPGRRAVHNSSYWKNKPYIGLGPGAHSWDGRVRRANPHSLSGYLDSLSKGKVFYETEEETETDRLNDMIMVSLRTSQGLELSKIPPRFRADFDANLKLIPAGDIVSDGVRIVIPEDRWLVSDATIRTLLV